MNGAAPGRKFAGLMRALAGLRDRPDVLSWMIVALGAVLMTWQYLAARALWLDEAYLVFNLKYLSAHQLLGPVYFSQLAPVGWLLLEKVMFDLWGHLEYALRLLPLAMGLAALALFRDLTFRLLKPAGALAALAALALSPWVHEYVVDVKPYSADILMTLAVLRLGLPMTEERTASLGRLLALAVAGLAGVAMSFPIVYVLGAVGGILFLQFAVQRRWRDAIVVAVASALWLAAFGALYLLVYKVQTRVGTLADAGHEHFFQRSTFGPFPPKSLGDLVWYAKWSANLFIYYFTGYAAVPAGLACLAGFIGFWRRSIWLALMLLAPIALALLGAAAAHAYPLYGRYAIFYAPVLFLFAGAGVDQLARGGAPRWALAAAAFAILAGPTMLLSWQYRRSPPFGLTHITPAIKTMGKDWKPGDVVYVQASATPAYLLYRSRYGLGQAPWRIGYETTWSCVLKDLGADAARRVWVLAPIDIGLRPLPVLGDADKRQYAAHGVAADLVSYRNEIELVKLQPATAKALDAGVAEQACLPLTDPIAIADAKSLHANFDPALKIVR